MTAEPARAEPDLACAEPGFRRPGRPDGVAASWLVRALTMLDPDGQVEPDRPAIFRTLAAALSVRTGAFWSWTISPAGGPSGPWAPRPPRPTPSGRYGRRPVG